jgi:hypothetical protein
LQGAFVFPAGGGLQGTPLVLTWGLLVALEAMEEVEGEPLLGGALLGVDAWLGSALAQVLYPYFM